MHSEQPASSAFSPVGAPQLGQVSNLPEINLFSQLAPYYAQGQQGQPGGITAQQLQLWQLQQLQTVREIIQEPRALRHFETCRDVCTQWTWPPRRRSAAPDAAAD